MYDKPKAHFWEPNIIARTDDAFWYSPIADAAAHLAGHPFGRRDADGGPRQAYAKTRRFVLECGKFLA
jgi:hypothetical protein